MSVFIKCNGIPGSELGCAGENIQLVFAGFNKISIAIHHKHLALLLFAFRDLWKEMG